MKRTTAGFFVLMLVMLCGCGQGDTEITGAIATPGPTAPPTQTTKPSPGPSPEETPFLYRRTTEDTVIISDISGNVLGGYSDGQWLTHSQAAAYCGDTMTFAADDLAGTVYRLESAGIEYPEENNENHVYSRTKDMGGGGYDAHGYYELRIEKPEICGFNYNEDPLWNAYLYYGGSLPDVEVLSDTSDIQPVIQDMLDGNFGAGVMAAEVRIAVSADIDGDGGKETIVNADNNGQVRYDSIWGEGRISGDTTDEAHNWYSLACIIETDGAVRLIYGYFENAWIGDSEFLYVQNIIDLNGDGKCEIVLVREAWETRQTIVYEYDGTRLTEALVCGADG
jgi:hypothetical protein